jgi:ABC-type Fe3+ transport system permease subunit
MADSQALSARNGQTDLVGRGREDNPELLPVEEDIRTTREQIARTASQIQQKIRTDLDWKQWIQRYPLRTVTIAVAAGTVVGFALPSGGRSSHRREDRRGLRSSEQQAIQETGKTTILASIAANVATTLLREGANYLAQRVFRDEGR